MLSSDPPLIVMCGQSSRTARWTRGLNKPPRIAGLPRPQKYSAHGAIYGTVANTFQRLLESLGQQSSNVRLNRICDDRLQRRQAIGQRSRPWLQNQRRFDLVQRARFHRWNAIEAWPLGELFRTNFLAAPRADNDIGLVARQNILSLLRLRL